MKFSILIILLLSSFYAIGQEKDSILNLEEIVLFGQQIPKHQSKITLKGKKTFVYAQTPYLSVISNHFQKKENQLFGVKFTLDTSALDDKENLFIRLLIMTEEKQEIFNSSENFPLNKTTKDIIFSFKKPLLFKKNTSYFIGFEVLDKNNTMKKIQFRGVANYRRGITFIRGIENTDWYKINAPYSLDYELYFEK